jgi:hypothetical protein
MIFGRYIEPVTAPLPVGTVPAATPTATVVAPVTAERKSPAVQN